MCYHTAAQSLPTNLKITAQLFSLLRTSGRWQSPYSTRVIAVCSELIRKDTVEFFVLTLLGPAYGFQVYGHAILANESVGTKAMAQWPILLLLIISKPRNCRHTPQNWM